MAMTLKERGEMTSLRQQLAEARAMLPWQGSDPVRIPAPTGSAIINGWDFNQYRQNGVGHVFEAWSQSFVHGEGVYSTSPRRHASQGSVALYNSRLDALMGLRAAQTAKFGKMLAAIDAQIAEEGGA